MADVMVASLKDSLSSLGLTQYESIAYLSLINDGVCSARELSNTCGMPYGKTYEIIRNLEKKGFAEVLPTKPMKCAAVDPEHVFRLVKESFLSKVQKIENCVKRSMSRKRNRMAGKPVFLMVKGRSLINAKIEALLKGAKKGVVICTTENGLRRLMYFDELLKQKCSSGVTVQVICNHEPENCSSKEHRHLAACDPLCRNSFISVDGKESIFFEAFPDDCDFVNGRDRGLSISDRSSTQFFDMLLMSCTQEILKGESGKV